ncbi:hypothetical protein GQ43DRAFT_57774 [Delitschia confertaspora ATCC 74209]|uniref:Uncharacterized protein n=1 Tax=Delitschia confertaspora ATCC 74209 TaxID=1513339 RepID=A0A9P4JQN6_9PLEO|nr:hypothetical protein GQ43DRAFT_57774 [Delitschia confertaspora ATCC 74209]
MNDYLGCNSFFWDPSFPHRHCPPHERAHLYKDASQRRRAERATRRRRSFHDRAQKTQLLFPPQPQLSDLPRATKVTSSYFSYLLHRHSTGQYHISELEHGERRPYQNPTPEKHRQKSRDFEWAYPDYHTPSSPSSFPDGYEYSDSIPRPPSPSYEHMKGEENNSTGNEPFGLRAPIPEQRGYACTVTSTDEEARGRTTSPDSPELETTHDNENNPGVLGGFGSSISAPGSLSEAPDPWLPGKRESSDDDVCGGHDNDSDMDVEEDISIDHHDPLTDNGTSRRSQQYTCRKGKNTAPESHHNILPRWKDLLEREARLAKAQTNFQALVGREEQRLKVEKERLEQQDYELRMQQRNLDADKAALQQEKNRLAHAQDRRPRSSFFSRRQHVWPDNDIWDENTDGYGSEAGIGNDGMDMDMDGGHDQPESGFCHNSRERRGGVSQDKDTDSKDNCPSCGSYWASLPTTHLTPSSPSILYPTPSGLATHLIDSNTLYISAVQSFFLRPGMRSPDFRYLGHDDIIKYNTIGFFLASFCIPLSYRLPPPSPPSPFHVFPNFAPPRSPFSSTGKLLLLPDLDSVPREKIERLRDHLHKKEVLRWHPDQFNKRVTEDQEIEFSSPDGSGRRITMGERDIGRVVDEVVRELKKDCEDALGMG